MLFSDVTILGRIALLMRVGALLGIVVLRRLLRAIAVATRLSHHRGCYRGDCQAGDEVDKEGREPRKHDGKLK